MTKKQSKVEDNIEYFVRTYIWTSQCWYCKSDIKLAYTMVEKNILGQYDGGLNSYIPAIETIKKIEDEELIFELRYNKIGDHSSYSCVCPHCDKSTHPIDIFEELFDIFSSDKSELMRWVDQYLKHQEQISREKAYSGRRFE